MDDKLMISYIKRKNEKGLEALILKYGGYIQGIIRQHLANFREFEEECMDDVLIAIWENIDTYRETGSFKSWIGVMAKFKAIDIKRKHYRQKDSISIDGIDLVDQKDFVTEILEKEFKNEFVELLRDFNEKDQRIFLSHYFDGKEIQEISIALGISKEQIYNRLSRGRRKLQLLLKGNR